MLHYGACLSILYAALWTTPFHFVCCIMDYTFAFCMLHYGLYLPILYAALWTTPFHFVCCIMDYTFAFCMLHYGLCLCILRTALWSTPFAFRTLHYSVHPSHFVHCLTHQITVTTKLRTVLIALQRSPLPHIWNYHATHRHNKWTIYKNYVNVTVTLSDVVRR
jgi:hypothetical protein